MSFCASLITFIFLGTASIVPHVPEVLFQAFDFVAYYAAAVLNPQDSSHIMTNCASTYADCTVSSIPPGMRIEAPPNSICQRFKEITSTNHLIVQVRSEAVMFTEANAEAAFAIWQCAFMFSAV